jgi:hypothetical protein
LSEPREVESRSLSSVLALVKKVPTLSYRNIVHGRSLFPEMHEVQNNPDKETVVRSLSMVDSNEYYSEQSDTDPVEGMYIE